MKRLFSRSCLGLLALIMISCIVTLLIFTVIFQQSQATLSNATATQVAHVTATHSLRPTPYPSVTIVFPMPSDLPAEEVTIQVQPNNSTVVFPTAQAFPTLDLPGQLSPTATVVHPPISTSTDVPRNSGTSTYPLTLTAEVMFAQTNVAHYQSGVAATRTAIAADSQSIYATLTAGAPVPTESH